MKDSDAYNLPSSFKWPTERDFAETVTDAYKQVGFDSAFARELLAPPIQSQVNGVITAFQASTQKGIVQLASELSKASGSEIPNLVGKVASLSFALANGDVTLAIKTGTTAALDIAAQVAGQLGTQLAKEVAGVVPLVGVVVSYVMDVIDYLAGGMSDEEKAELVAEAQTQLEKRLAGDCPRVVSNYAATATGSGGPLPSDMFRGVLLAAETGNPLPPTLASLFVMFCGGESQGVGMTRREWSKLDAEARNATGAKGFDAYTQRRMFALVKSIMKSAKDPSLSAKWEVWGDGGTTAFGTLNELMRTGYERGSWNLAYSRRLEAALGQFWGDAKTVQFDQGFGTVYATCGDKLKLTDQLEQTQRVYINNMMERFCQEGPGHPCNWRATATASQLEQLAAGRPQFVLNISELSGANLIESATQAEESQKQSGSILPAVGVAAALAGAAYWSLKK